MELSELVACTLSDTDLKSQRERWLNLGENFGLGRQETKHGLRLSFRSHPAVREELDALVAVENECCSWAAWSVEQEGDTLVMAARSKGMGVTTLHGMFTQFA
ncbi:MAG TPA: hypothetical protein VKB43_06385 [Gaiellaceae bacterium]|nr:hypothetical protein [Gaiellaceae bacterium]